MINNAYVIYDSKSGLYNKPFYFVNDAVAIRAANELLQDNNHEISKFPEDYTLFKIGEFDDETGEFTSHEARTSIVKFHELSNKLRNAA